MSKPDSTNSTADNAEASPKAVDPAQALSECLFAQYTLTATGVAVGTAYAMARKPKNGVGIMIVAGAAGTMGDLMYGWVKTCKPQVEAWYKAPRSD